MAVFTIAGLVIKEAVRRRTLVGAFLMGLMVLAISLLISVIRLRMQHQVAVGRMSIWDFATRFPIARSVVTGLCLSCIKMLGALFAALLAGGAISGEIERGVLAVILPKPVPRWQILLGKWIGLMLILVGSVLLWTTMLWASLAQQEKGMQWGPILRAGPVLALYPVLVGTLTLTFSVMLPRLLGTTLSVLICAVAWFDGILNSLAKTFDVDILYVIARVVGMILPQGYIGWWVESVTHDMLYQNPRGGIGESPRFLTDWGANHLHFAHLDVVYVAVYVVVLFLIGVLCFQRRDV